MSEQKIDYRRYDYTKARLEAMSLNDLIDELHRLEDIEDNRDELRFVLEDVIDATRDYLPPDGISAQQCIDRVLTATDNPEINAALSLAKGEAS